MSSAWLPSSLLSADDGVLTLVIFLLATLACGGLALAVAGLGAREKTFEEALEEQKRGKEKKEKARKKDKKDKEAGKANGQQEANKKGYAKKKHAKVRREILLLLRREMKANASYLLLDDTCANEDLECLFWPSPGKSSSIDCNESIVAFSQEDEFRHLHFFPFPSLNSA